MPLLARTLGAVRDAAWLDERRARGWLVTFALVTAVGVLGWIGLSSSDGVDPSGKPLGTDFISFWTGSKLVLQGAPAAAVYDIRAHAVAEQAAFPTIDVGFSPFPYPPPFLLFCLPLGLLPYLPSLAAWLAVTGYGYLRVVRAWLGTTAIFPLPVVAFPAVLLNLGHGQNGFLTAGLFGAGALTQRRRPLVAGLCFGALILKPHLGLLIPVVLLFSRQWRVLAATAASALTLALAATLAFGIDTWAAFVAKLDLMRAVLEQNLLDPGKLQSFFAALRLWGAPPAVAYAAQACLALSVAAVLSILAWRRPAGPALGASLVAGALLATPYVLDYDLTLAAIPMAWLFNRARRTGFGPWEKTILLAAFVLPLVSRLAAMDLRLPLAPPVLAALFMATVARAWRGEDAAAEPAQTGLALSPTPRPA